MAWTRKTYVNTQASSPSWADTYSGAQRKFVETPAGSTAKPWGSSYGDMLPTQAIPNTYQTKPLEPLGRPAFTPAPRTSTTTKMLPSDIGRKSAEALDRAIREEAGVKELTMDSLLSKLIGEVKAPPQQVPDWTSLIAGSGFGGTSNPTPSFLPGELASLLNPNSEVFIPAEDRGSSSLEEAVDWLADNLLRQLVQEIR